MVYDNFVLQYSTVKPVIGYFKDAKAELSKVIWPKPKEVIKLTLTVLLVTLIIGVYLGALDLGYVKLLEQLVK